jgi:hypothetical protein
MDYQTFCRNKHVRPSYSGFDIPLEALGDKAFQWQKRCIQWAVKRGRAALFADTGLGKSLQQLLWADAVVKHSGGHIMGHCPVGVRWQTAGEAQKFGIETPVVVVNTPDEIPSQPSICLVNYEKMHLFETHDFTGVFLDESSCLKGLNSKTREALTAGWQHSPFRLACTATPAPNDTMELGNHAEFLGICTREEMLSKYFTHDSGDTSKWRLKGHAEADFWDWVCSWAVCISRPSDIGGDDTGYILPELHEITHNVHVPGQVKAGQLFDVSGISATNIHEEKRYTSPFRAEKTAELVRSNDRPWIIWCDTNYEADDIRKLLPDVVEIRGSDTEQQKEDRLRGFTEGRIRTILTKSSMFGQGMNWQHCNQMIFHSINYSFESRYQAIRRCWRFGQTQEVFVHSVTTDTEHAIANTLSVKDARHDNLQTAMSAAMQRSELLASSDAGMTRYNPTRKAQVPSWLQS